ncbi:MAG: penicillin-binding protein, partial [Ruminococcus sp.]|nr:penicillin-binding protein [Ruminococcus sp.]
MCATKDGSRSFHSDYEVRNALLHIVGDNHGFISSSVQNQYRTDLSGYNRIMGVWELCNFEQGSAVELSLDAQACKTAYRALNGRKGAVCVYNYKTGATLVSVSTPTYDPENVPYNINDNEYYDGVYINRVTMGLYPPGSTFKVITAAAAIDNVGGIENKTFTCDGAYHTSYGDVNCMSTHGQLQMKEALAKSCNAAFAEIANEVGGKKLQKTAENFGYNKKVSLGKLGVYTSEIKAAKDDQLELGWAGIGQSTTLVTPLLQTRIMGAIANGGVPVEPYLVQKVTSASGFVQETASAKEGKRALSEETAREVKSLL